MSNFLLWVNPVTREDDDAYRQAYLRSDIDLFVSGVGCWIAVIVILVYTDLKQFPVDVVMRQMLPLRMFFMLASVSVIVLLVGHVRNYREFNALALVWTVFSAVMTSVFFIIFRPPDDQSQAILSLLIIISYYVFTPNPLRIRLAAPLLFSITLLVEMVMLRGQMNIELQNVTYITIVIIHMIGISFSERIYSERYKAFLARQHEAEIRAELEVRAATDPLTGVWNRRRLLELADEELYRFQRYGRVFSILFMDLDGFKIINDSLGHLVGDTVLVKFANEIQTLKRESDALGRMGGDEFCLLLPETTAQAASVVAGRILAACEATGTVHPTPGEALTVSIGITEAQPGDTRLDQLYARADKALYAAKNQGRSRWAIE